jgi:MFS transporter, SET family, sugar efflux transporter
MAFSFVLPFVSIFGINEVGMSAFIFGLFMAITSIAGMGISTVLARWSDTRYSRRTMLLIGGIAGCLGYLGFAFIRDIRLLFLIGSVLLGIASITFSQIFAHARNLLDRSDIESRMVPLYMNVFRLCFALSWTIGPALAALVMRHYAFRGTYLVASILFLMFIILVACFIPALPPSKASKDAAVKMSLLKAIRLPGLMPNFMGLSFFFICSTMGMMNLPILILNGLHGKESHVGWAYSIAPIFEIPFMFFIGLLATRWESPRLIRAAMGIAILYYIGLALVQVPWQVYPLQILSAVIVSVTSGVAITFFQNFLPDQAGTATNLYSNASRIGSTIGYLLFGYLSSALGNRAVFIVCVGLCSISLFLLQPKRA